MYECMTIWLYDLLNLYWFYFTISYCIIGCFACPGQNNQNHNPGVYCLDLLVWGERKDFNISESFRLFSCIPATQAGTHLGLSVRMYVCLSVPPPSRDIISQDISGYYVSGYLGIFYVRISRDIMSQDISGYLEILYLRISRDIISQDISRYYISDREVLSPQWFKKNWKISMKTVLFM